MSTQRPDQLSAFAEHARLPFDLLSDTELAHAAALRLPTFRAAVTDPAASVDEALALVPGE